MSIYIYSNKKCPLTHMFYTKLHKGFILNDFEAELISKDTENKMGDLTDCIIIGDYQNVDIRRFLSNDECLYILKNLPDGERYGDKDNFIHLVDYNPNLKSKMTKKSNGFWVDGNKIMCLWGCSLSKMELRKINYDLMTDKIKKDNKFYIFKHPGSQTMTKLNSIKKQHNYIPMIRSDRLMQKLDKYSGHNLLFTTKVFDNDFIDICARAGNCVTNCVELYDVLEGNIEYINDVSLGNINSFIENGEHNKTKKIELLSLIYSKYLMSYRCKDIVDFINTY